MIIPDICIPTNKKRSEIDDLIKDIKANTPEFNRIIASCQPLSASKNRNYCLSFANSDIIVMMDDDITGFYPGWLTNFIHPMLEDPLIIICSARLLDKNRKRINNMGMIGGSGELQEIPASFNHKGTGYKRVTTACIAIRKNHIRFDEEYIKSGYEDTDFMNQISRAFPASKFIVNNNCELIHLNHMQGQDDREAWQHNHDHYCKKWEFDTVAKDQKCWAK